MATVRINRNAIWSLRLLKGLQSLRFGQVHFWICSAVIAAMSAWDTYLVMAYQQSITFLEKNPICLALIKLDPDSLIYFIAAKAVGTLAVVTILTALFHAQRRIGIPVVVALTAFQIGLIAYQFLA